MNHSSHDPISLETELVTLLQAQPDLAYVDAIFIDLCGIVRCKRYPRDEAEKLLESGFPIPHSIYLLDVTGACNDPCGRGFTDGDPDGIAVPVPGTLVPVPWSQRPAGQVLMRVENVDGSPSAVDPRNIAERVVARFDELELTPSIAFELEFFLIAEDEDEDGRPQVPVGPNTGKRDLSTQVYGMSQLNDFADFFHDVEEAGKIQSIPVSVASSEYAPGQYEVNLHHVCDPLLAADHCGLLRHLIRSVAQRHRLSATFMPKPFLESTGSGMHVHMSLADTHGNNVFDDGSEAGTETLRYAVGGLLQTMYAGMAIFAPHVNAFRRYGANLFVPVNRSWGYNNRSSALRIPTGEAVNRRFEHRVASADANPYLVLGALLAGVHHGISNKVDPGPAWQGNVCDTRDPDMPLDIERAVARLEASTLLRSYFGEEYVDIYAEAKRAEWQRFQRHISRHEYQWYL